MLEELLELGMNAEYDAWPIRINEGDQFSSGFVSVNPNSKIPALLDRGTSPPQRVFESGAILLYLAEKFGAFLPTDRASRSEEHTSELPSLMRISYAVFCLKKKKHNHTET